LEGKEKASGLLETAITVPAIFTLNTPVAATPVACPMLTETRLCGFLRTAQPPASPKPLATDLP
jgi:hypothetical protein